MDQRREPTRRFASRRGLEGEIVDFTDVSGSGDTSNMRSTTAPTPEQFLTIRTDIANRARYEECGIHGFDFDDDCGWCWIEVQR